MLHNIFLFNSWKFVKIEHKIGDTFEYYSGIFLKVVEDTDISCNNCYFENKLSPCNFLCGFSERSDKKSIKYVKIDV